MSNHINFDVAKMKLPDGKTLESALKSEANRLKSLLQAEINRWYASYSPVQYPRSYNMRDSIYVDDVVRVGGSGNQLTVSLKYSDSAYHKSLWSNEKVNVIYLENYGYRVSKGWHKNIPYFGYRSQGGYLEDAVRAFNQSGSLGFKATIIELDSLYK